MIIRGLSVSPTSQLVNRFEEIALSQHDALWGGDVRLFNRLSKEMTAVELELKSRSGDQRSELLPLLAHPNLTVRWKASAATLAIAPEVARRALEAVAKSGERPFSGHAASMLGNFDSGFWKPT